MPARIAWLRVAARGGRLAVSFTVLRRFRRRGRRAYGTGVLKAIVHFLSFTSYSLRYALLATVPGYFALASRDRCERTHH